MVCPSITKKLQQKNYSGKIAIGRDKNTTNRFSKMQILRRWEQFNIGIKTK